MGNNSWFCLSGCFEEFSDGRDGFDDDPFYDSLCSETGCRSVEISSLSIHRMPVFHELAFVRIQASYRLTFADGTTTVRMSPQHFEELRHGTETLIPFQENEFLQGLRVHQNFLAVFCITFVTNLRQVRVGNPDALACRSTTLLPGGAPWTKIVSFAGTKWYHRIGFNSRPLTCWKTIHAFIGLRKLVAQGRAERVTTRGTNDTIVQRLIALDEGPFLHALEFLVPTVLPLETKLLTIID